ncbi:MAG: ceramidase domain-containing protein [Vicinamibacteria bacterium]
MIAPLVAALAPWQTWAPATCLPDDCFCEAIRDGLVRQPANTWSSFAFLLAAVWVAGRPAHPRSSASKTLPRTEHWLLVSSLMLVGLGSAFYHASLTFIGQVFDVSGMYLVATFILLHRLGPTWKLPPVGSVLVFVGVNAGLMMAQVTTPSLRRLAFGILLVGALAVEWRSARRGRRWLAIGASLMAVAFVIWILDRWRLVCATDSLVQGHAAWHLLGALAAVCLYRSYESEPSLSP